MPLPPERVVVDLPLAEAGVPDVERLVPIIPIEAPELETPLVPAPSAADATQSARTWARSLDPAGHWINRKARLRLRCGPA